MNKAWFKRGLNDASDNFLRDFGLVLFLCCLSLFFRQIIFYGVDSIFELLGLLIAIPLLNLLPAYPPLYIPISTGIILYILYM